MRIVLTLVCLAMFAVQPAFAKRHQHFESAPIAKAFGASPAMWGLSLSPDGSKVSFLSLHKSGAVLAVVLDSSTGKGKVVLAGDPGHFRISWCKWKNNDRLLCGLYMPVVAGFVVYPETRLVAVNADGSERKLLLQKRLEVGVAQLQDRIVDWLPDDKSHVLVLADTREGSGINSLNVYDGTLTQVELPRKQVRGWLTDGHGTPRLYTRVEDDAQAWYVRDAMGGKWTLLHRTPFGKQGDVFSPIGFAASRNELLVYDSYEGHVALFGIDLAKGQHEQLIFANPTLDVAGVQRLGKYQRLVAAVYVGAKPHMYFFDATAKAIEGRLARYFRNQAIDIIAEDWQHRYYLVFVSSDQKPGTYYRFDSTNNALARIGQAYPTLAGRSLVPMQAIQYKADDGTEIPGYLTRPAHAAGHAPGPAVILPHGGPSARDYWEYDFLVQYLAAKGYTVLQSNYRGSSGYGTAWQGAGGFKNWEQVVHDITDGAQYLVKQGIADPKRICIVGWSYGGYAALMSVIEHPKLYQCVASIAGVTDPVALGEHMRRHYVGGRAAQMFIGRSDNVSQKGSPVERAGEITVPVFLAQGDKDMNVPITQGQKMDKTLEHDKKRVQFIEYEDAEHSIRPERDRIDLLTRLGKFLDKQIGG